MIETVLIVVACLVGAYFAIVLIGFVLVAVVAAFALRGGRR